MVRWSQGTTKLNFFFSAEHHIWICETFRALPLGSCGYIVRAMRCTCEHIEHVELTAAQPYVQLKKQACQTCRIALVLDEKRYLWYAALSRISKKMLNFKGVSIPFYCSFICS